MLQKFIQSALLLVVLFTTVQSYAQVSQAPDGIQFQALATDANGHPAAGRVIYVKDAIIAKTATGTIVYSETFKVTASSAGIFTIVLGKGTYASGVSSIANIDWANGPFFLNLKIAVEPTVPTASWNVNNEYVDLGTSQFWSVPYALYAGSVKGLDTKLNIADTAAMLKPYFTAINLKANIESPTFTGTVSGITKAMVGLANVDNTSDLNKPISTATKTALDLKANAADVTAALNLKANTADVTTALALKANTADVTEALNLKANTTDVNTALALKANTADVTTALNLKANTTDVTTGLATKVDKVTGKELSTNDYTTAEKTKLAAITGTNTGDQDLSALAVAANVNAALALKANTADVNTALALKANTANVTSLLAAKADVVNVNNAIAAINTSLNTKADAVAVNNSIAVINNSLNTKADVVALNNAVATLNGTLATKENNSNKSVNITTDAASDTKYPSVKSVKTYVDAQVAGANIADADANTKGKIQLAGDLAGTAAAPTVPGLALKANTSSLSTVATSGSYNDLSNKPTIPSAYTLPTASTSVLGGVKVGSNLSVDANSVLSANINAGSISGTVTVANGGTGATTLTGLVKGNGTNALTAAVAGTDYQAPLTLTTTGTGAATFSGTTLNIPLVSSTVDAGSISGTVTVANGGTGATTLTGLVKGNGTNALTAAVAGTDYQAPLTLATTGTGAATFSGTTLTIPTYSLPIADGTNLGGVKIGSNLSIDANGVLSAAAFSNDASTFTGVLPIAKGGTGTTTVAGIKSAIGLSSTSVAIGDQAGQTNQADGGVGVGGGAGANNQGGSAVAIGYVAGYNNQGASSVAIGPNAAQSGQGSTAVAIGFAAGQNGQGANSVAIGSFAGNTQVANSIAINATGMGTPLNPTNSGFYVDPIRNVSTSNSLFYDVNTKEITYGTAPPSGQNYVDLSSAQTITGAKTFNKDIVVNSVMIGKGGNTQADNIAIGNGARSGNINLGGNANIAIGTDAQKNNTGFYNVSIGNANLVNGSGDENTALGYTVMANNTTGMRNTGVGLFSFYQNTTGNYNTAIGLGSLGTNTTGSYNTALGTGADVAADNLTNATAIGYGASVAASNTIQIGNAYVTKVNTSGSITAGTVSYPNTHNSTSGQVLTINSNGVSSWANPASSGVPYTGATGAVNLGAYDLTVNGLNIGRGAGNISTNTSVGSNALVSNSGGGYNTAVGIGALQVNTNGSFNTSLGTNALLYNNGDQNIAVGSAALQNNTSGNLNTALGFSSNTANTSGSENTSLGHGSLSNNTTGSSNTAIGAQSNVVANNLSNATALGYQATVAASNSIQLGNSNVANVKTSGTLTAGDVTYPREHGTDGQVLTTTGSGSAIWSNIVPPLGKKFITTIAGPIDVSNYSSGDVVYDQSAGNFYFFKEPKQSSLGFNDANSSFSFFDFGKDVIKYKPSVSANITSVSIEIGGATNAVFSIYSRLIECGGGEVATVDASSLLGSSSANSGSGILTFNFPTPISVTSNTEYYITVSSGNNSVSYVRVKTGVNDSNFSISYGSCSIDQGSPSIQIAYATSFTIL